MDAKTNEYRFHMEKPFLLDAKGVRYDLEYDLKFKTQNSKLKIDSQYDLSVQLPRDWMTDSSRAYPVILDPTVTHNTQTAFATGTLNRVKDEGVSDGTPLLTTSYHELAADINTVGLWHLNEASGNAVDSSGNGITGTVTGTTVIAGRLNNGRLFNGTSDNVTTLSNPLTYFTASKQYTVEGWVKLDQYQPNGGTGGCCGSRIAYNNSGDGGFDWRIWNNGVVNFYRPTTWCAAGSTKTVPLNKWVHLAATYNNQQVIVYMDGEQIASTSTCNFLDSTAGVTFNHPGGSHGLYGSMDEFRISKIARTPEEIKQDAQRLPYSVYTSSVINLSQATSANTFTWMGKGIRSGDGENPVSTSGLVGFWKLNESASPAIDSSGNGNSGTWNNSPTVIEGRYGNALDFDGDGKNMQLTSSISVSGTPYSISLWSYFPLATSTGGWRTLTRGASYDHQVLVQNDGQLGVYDNQGGTGFHSSGFNINTLASGWHHLTAVGSGTTTQFYIDSKLVGTSDFKSNAQITSIGNSGVGGNQNWGKVDNLQIFPAPSPPPKSSPTTQPVTSSSKQEQEVIARPMMVPGLVGQWNFNESSGITLSNLAATTCGSSCNATLNNFANTSAPDALAGSGWTAKNAKWGSGALMFDGSNDTVSIADTPALRLITYSAEIWFKGSQQNEYWKGIVGKPGRNINVWLGNANGSAGFIHHRFHDQAGTNSGCPDTPNVITWGSWHQIVLTNNGTTCNTYVDGILQATNSSFSGPLIADNSSVIFGSNLDGGASNYFNGTIDSARIYSSALSAEEISANYASGNLELQTRSNGSGWEDWKPITNEIQLLSLDSDAVNWTSSNSNTLSLSNDSVTKVEGTGSLKATIGAPVVDTNTVALWHFDETSALLDATVGASSGNPGLSCLDILGKRGTATDGVYWIQPTGETSAIQVNCNMTRDGGGWTLGLKSWYQAGGLFGNTAAVGVVTDATTLKGNAYKLSDGVIRNLIGPAQNFDVMADQAGWNSGYSSGNYEYVIARNYTGYWRFDTRVAASSTTTSFQSYRLSDNALAWTGNWQCGNVGGWGINCYNMLSGNPQGGAGCNINMGYQSNAGWHHFYMGETNTDTYLYVCNGPQHSSSYNMNHRWWFRERGAQQVTPRVYLKDISGKYNHATPKGATVTNGYYGNGRSFNGSTDYIEVESSTSLGLSNMGSVEAWVKLSNNWSAQGAVVAKGALNTNDETYSLYIDTNKVPQFYLKPVILPQQLFLMRPLKQVFGIIWLVLGMELYYVSMSMASLKVTNSRHLIFRQQILILFCELGELRI